MLAANVGEGYGTLPMGLAELQLILLPIVFAAGWGGGWVALRIASGSAVDSRLGMANALASGIILGTGLLHMLPEAAEALDQLYPDYPFAYLLAALSFLGLLLVEHVVLGHRGHKHGELAPHGMTELPGELAVHAGENRGAAYVLLAGLSTHSILTGIALGAQDEAAPMMAILVAIIAHKSTEGFALGISLGRNRVAPALCSSLLAAFAAATPLGIVIGMAASNLLHGGVGLAFEAVFSAIAAGTFVYVASLDMIGEEFSHGERPFAKWLLALIGLLITAALASL